MDVNGSELHDIFKFLKRNSPELFVPRFGMAQRIYDYNTKFLMNRYGEVKYYYKPNTNFLVIEQDVKRLIDEEWNLNKWNNLNNPPDMFS